MGVTSLHPKLTPAQGFGLEFFTTFGLVIVVLGVCDSHRTDVKGSGPLAIGLTVALGILVTVISFIETRSISTHSTYDGWGGKINEKSS